MSFRRLVAAACPAVLVTGLAVALSAPAHAEPATAYEMPFPCGQWWTGSTRSGHSPGYWSVDFNRDQDLGDPVVAAADGVVSVADSVDNSGYGRWVRIQHGNNESTIYAHLQSVKVSVNRSVDRGDLIGYLGSTGNSSGPHLHFEERQGSSVVRPWFHGKQFTYGVATESRNCRDATPEPPPPAPEPATSASTGNVPLGANQVKDAKGDLTVFRRLERGTFVIRRPGGTPLVRRMGRGTDTPLAGHWDGGTRAMPGVFRPSTNTFYLRVPGGNVTIPFGQAGDVPLAGDWDGDGTTEIGVRRGSTFIKRAADGETWTVTLGKASDVPVVGDWNRDRIADLGVYDPATSTFTLRILGKDWVARKRTVVFGAPGSVPVLGDWDANGFTDLGVWDRETSTFSLRRAWRPTSSSSWTQRIRFSGSQG